MRIERFEIPGLAQYSYIVSAGGLALVVDPIRDIDRYIAYVADQGLKITHVTETHIPRGLRVRRDGAGGSDRSGARAERL